ncbi:MAG: hypothetical protein R6U78_08210 [Bacteroidales bacterium]
MKKLTILSTAVLLALSLGINAQHQHRGGMDQQGDSPKMQGNMMGQMGQRGMMGMMCPMCGNMMMQDMPMRKYRMMVNMLPNMQNQLSLSQEQVETLIDLQTDFRKQQIDYQARLSKNRMKLKSLLDDNASADNIRQELEACSEIQTSMKLTAYEAANEMKNELTEEQRTQLMDLMSNQAGMMQGQGMMMQNMMNQ